MHPSLPRFNQMDPYGNRLENEWLLLLHPFISLSLIERVALRFLCATYFGEWLNMVSRDHIMCVNSKISLSVHHIQSFPVYPCLFTCYHVTSHFSFISCSRNLSNRIFLVQTHSFFSLSSISFHKQSCYAKTHSTHPFLYNIKNIILKYWVINWNSNFKQLYINF